MIQLFLSKKNEANVMQNALGPSSVQVAIKKFNLSLKIYEKCKITSHHATSLDVHFVIWPIKTELNAILNALLRVRGHHRLEPAKQLVRLHSVAVSLTVMFGALGVWSDNFGGLRCIFSPFPHRLDLLMTPLMHQWVCWWTDMSPPLWSSQWGGCLPPSSQRPSVPWHY